jgi:hypothetical protein
MGKSLDNHGKNLQITNLAQNLQSLESQNCNKKAAKNKGQMHVTNQSCYLFGFFFLPDLCFNLSTINFGTEVDDGCLLLDGEHVDGFDRVGLSIDIVLLNCDFSNKVNNPGICSNK